MATTTILPPLFTGSFLLTLGAFQFTNARKLFAPRYGRRHRLFGLVYFLWLAMGTLDTLLAPSQYAPNPAIHRNSLYFFAYDMILAILGTLLTLTAALDFGNAHGSVSNPPGVASGTLSDKATVSTGEMYEHLYYQLLNGAQAAYLHVSRSAWAQVSLGRRFALLAAVTAPWLVRGTFPVNSFSANYDPRRGATPSTLVNVLYRLKKYQYLLYKHFLLHGLNIFVAASGALPHATWGHFRHALSRAIGIGAPESFGIVSTPSNGGDAGIGGSAMCAEHALAQLDPSAPAWRSFWICLNASYVMEFFLQTLVKRGLLPQTTMLRLNQLLMAASTLAAIQVRFYICAFLQIGIFSGTENCDDRRVICGLIALQVLYIHIFSSPITLGACFLSWALNFQRRGKELTNTALVVTTTMAAGSAVFWLLGCTIDSSHSGGR